MGDFPRHSHEVIIDGLPVPVTTPVSVLDCDQEACRRRADLAKRGAYYSLDSIKSRLADAKDQLRAAMDSVQMWELVLEAKERETT